MRISDSRVELRANVFLSAVLAVQNGSIPVRIRNLSPWGALLEGPDLPTEGRVTLRRGRLQVSGILAWRGDGCCGLRFDSEVIVGDWLKRGVNSGQERVDGMMAALRSGTPYVTADAEVPTSIEALFSNLLEVVERMAGMPAMSTEMGEELVKVEALILELQTEINQKQPRRA